MLQAILNGKSRRIVSDISAGTSLREVYGRSEDMLTGAIFGRLAYLEGPVLWKILRKTFRPDILPERTVVSLENVEFWPRWSKAEDQVGTSVEPDVVMTFMIGDPGRKITLIIEVKLGSSGQYPEQWLNEWRAHEASSPQTAEPDSVYLLAIGGVNGRPEAVVASFMDRIERLSSRRFPAAAANWGDLLEALHEVDTPPSQRRIISDLKEALALHGHRRSLSLHDLVDQSAALAGTFDRTSRSLPAHTFARPA